MRPYALFAALVVLLAVSAPATTAINQDDQQPEQVVYKAEQFITEAGHQIEDAAGSFMSSFMSTFAGMFGTAENDAATVAELAQQAPGNMSILINAINRADLQNVVADPNLEATIFCPTNAAFRAALIKLKLSVEDLYIDKTALTNILSYHVVGGSALTAADLKDNQKLTTVSQQELTVKVDKVEGTTIVGVTETAKVVAADLKAGKAVIHVIDTVLLPPKPTAQM